MKKIFLVYPVIILFFLSGCSKKEEEIKVKKPDEIKSEEKIDTTKQVSDSTKEAEYEEKENQQRYMEHRNVSKIQTSEAKSFIGEKVILKGYIADVVIREKVAYLNFDKKYPNNSCSVTIFDSEFDKFGDLEKYKNKNIEVNGRITEYRNKPQIIIKSPSQIKIVN